MVGRRKPPARAIAPRAIAILALRALALGGAEAALTAACSPEVVNGQSGAASGETSSLTASGQGTGGGTGGAGTGGAATGGAPVQGSSATGVLATTGAYTEPSACLQPDVCAAACANGLAGMPPPPNCADTCERFLINAGGCLIAGSYLSCVAGDGCDDCNAPHTAATCKAELEGCMQATAKGQIDVFANVSQADGCGAGCSCFGTNIQETRYIQDCVGTACGCYRDGDFYGSCTRSCAADPCTTLDAPCCNAAFGWKIPHA